MDLNSWLSYLETLHPKPIELGLDRITKVAKKLSILPYNKPVITVAGTNGKGSCVALLEQILLASGYRVGAYTSPHLLKYNERIRINGIDVSDEMLCATFKTIEQARGTITLTYFEFSTLAALLIFKQTVLDALILEVGMGGRLDAVNIVDPDIAIISTIALDHIEWLGPDRESIGREKAGIMRAAKPVVCGDFNIPITIEEFAKQTQAQLFSQNEDFGYTDLNDHWHWWSKKSELNDLPIPKVELQNAATVLMVIQLLSSKLNIPNKAITEGLRKVFIAGRFQVVDGISPCIFDVAHNPAATALLAKQLQKTANSGRTLAVFAMLKDKDQVASITPLLSQIDAWYVGGLAGSRGAPAKILGDNLRTLKAFAVHEYESVTMAYQAAVVDAQAGDRIIVFGSFHTVAEALQVRL